MKHRSVFVVVIALMAMLMIVPMGMVSADGHCEFADYTIKFGGLAPMSAPGAVAGGVAMDWTFKQAAADINADCGVQLDGVNYMLEVI
ncbi:MAG: hypothetical protein OXF90_07270, partial [Chloroflexi bacterium]|nr:hypothetical protein [Chloroflexota bacterium]